MPTAAACALLLNPKNSPPQGTPKNELGNLKQGNLA